MNETKEIQSGLHLEEVWNQRSKGDQLSAAEIFFHHLKLSLVFLVKSPLTSVLAVFSVATVLFILGLLSSFQRISLFGLSNATGQLQMSVFVKDSFTERNWIDLEGSIDKFAGLQTKRKIEKAEALNELRNLFSNSPELLSGLEEDNPLPASFEITFSSSYGESLADYAKQLQTIPGVESVSYDGQLAKVFTNLASRLKGIGSLTSIILIGLTLFLIATTIRISLYHESDEIEIMGLVGAYPAFIQAPFIIGGALQGFVGAVISCFFLWVIEGKIMEILRSEQIVKEMGINFSLLETSTIVLLVALGIGAGVIGSYFASKRINS